MKKSNDNVAQQCIKRSLPAKTGNAVYARPLGTTKRRKSRKKIDTSSFNQKNKKFFVNLFSLLVQQKLESLKEKNLAFEY